MPSHLNPNKCYNLPPSKPLAAVTAELPADCLSELVGLCILILKLDEDQALSFRSRFQYHTGEDATYSAKKALHHSLGLVYQRLSTTKDENEKKGIALKLHEGIPNCTEGFHDRVNSILMEESRDSLDGLLTQMRTDLILRATSQRTDEVHAHTRFFTIAATSGYGVRAIRLDDGYHGALSDNTIREAIQTVFNEHYQPFSILHTCLSMMKTELNGLGYVGERRMNTAYTLCPLEGTEFKRSSNLLYVKTQDEHLEYKTYNDGVYHSGKIPLIEFKQDRPIQKDSIIQKLWERGDTRTGYDLGEITSFLGYLQKILGQKPLDLSTYTLLDEDGHFIDLNWDTITKALFRTFINQEYFTFNAEQGELIEFFLSKPALIKTRDIEALLSNRMLPSLVSVCDLISLSDIKDPELTYSLLQGLIDGHPPSSRLALFQQIIHKIYDQEGLRNKLYAGNQRLLRGVLKKLKHRSLFSKYDALLEAVNHFRPEEVLVYLNFFHLPGALTKEEKFQLLNHRRKDDNRHVLMIALKHYHTLVAPLLKAMHDLSEEEQWILLSSCSSIGKNVLSIAARYHPRAIPQILELIHPMPVNRKIEILSHTCIEGYNALMYAARYNQGAIEPLIVAMSNLPEETKVKLFTHRTRTGFNVLMTAARTQARAVAPLLAMMNEFPTAEKIRILMNPCDKQFNSLMTAICHAPEEVAGFTSMINSFPQEEKIKILNQVNIQNYTPLMLAARNNVSALVSLLEMMQDLPPDIQMNIVMKTSNEGLNAFMMAVRCQPAAVKPFLTLMSTFPIESVERIFTQCDAGGFHALMHAARYQPSVVAPLLSMINGFSMKTKVSIFSQTCTQGCTVLMASTRFSPRELPLIIEMINTLPPDEKIKIIRQESITHQTALMMSVWRKSNVEIPLLEMMEDVPHALKIRMLTQTCNADNVLMKAVQHNTSAIMPLIGMSQNFSNEEKIRLLNLESQKYNALHLAAIYNPKTAIGPLLHLIDTLHKNPYIPVLDAFQTLNKYMNISQSPDLVELEMLLQLLRLKNKMAYFKAKKTDSADYKAAHFAAKKLYMTLRYGYDAYMKSDKTEKDFRILKYNWDLSIGQSRTVLSKHRGMSNLLANLLFCATILGVFFLLGRKLTHACLGKTENQRFFLPFIKTKSEVLLDRLSNACMRY